MQIQVLPDPLETAAAAARRIAQEAAGAVAERGSFALALSGGSTPWLMLDVLGGLDLEWRHTHVFQVDERCAPDGSAERNWTRIGAHLLETAPVPMANRHPMPVLDTATAAVAAYARALPPVLDVVQLGLGDDGHTASLVPGDLVLDVDDSDVAWTAAVYRGSRRMTLTYPCIARARRILWLVTGAAKAAMVARVVAGDPSIPAGRIPQDRAVLLCDEAAARLVRGVAGAGEP